MWANGHQFTQFHQLFHAIVSDSDRLGGTSDKTPQVRCDLVFLQKDVRTRLADTLENVQDMGVITGVENGEKEFDAAEMPRAKIARMPARLTRCGVMGRPEA
jgi:hypothetical protein